MRCPHCNGTGKRFVPTNKNAITGNGYTADCLFCNGTGEVDMTNEEWLHTLNTEEKAFALETIIRSALVQRSPMCHDVCNREFWERWLKEIHE